MNSAKKQLATPASALSIMYHHSMQKHRRGRPRRDQISSLYYYYLHASRAKRGSMLKQSSDNATSTQERRSSRVIHYNLSYIVQGAEHGTDGAIVLLHDILG